MKEEVRKVLNIPKGIRIAQHIYNLFRDYEEKLDVFYHDGTYRHEARAQGIDIFYVSDAEFIKRLKKGLDE